MACLTMSRATLIKKTTRLSTLAKSYDKSTKLNLFRQFNGSKIFQDTTRMNLKRWHRYVKTNVSHHLIIYIEGFYIDHGDNTLDEESIDRLWLVVRSLKNPEGKFDYKIKKFDTIKIGRVRFRVKDFRCE